MAAFAQSAELSEWLRQEIPPAQAVIALDAASASIRAYCGWNISQETVDDLVLTTSGGPSLWLPTQYLTAVSEVVENDVVLVAGTDYDWTVEGRLIRSGHWSRNARKVVVSFTHGYPTGHPVLGMVKGVCLSAAARLVDNPTGVRSWTTGGESATYAGGGSDLTVLLTDAERSQLPALLVAV